MKRGYGVVICLSLVIILSLSFVSAGLFSDFWNKITGKVVSSGDYLLNLKFDEGSGTTATDSSINGYSGTINGATWTTGKSGSALSFDEIDDYVKIPDMGSSSNELTISFWFKDNSVTSAFEYLFSWGNSGGSNSINVYIIKKDASGNTILRTNINNVTEYYKVIDFKLVPYLDNNWHLYTLTKNTAGSKVYVDGSLIKDGGSRANGPINPTSDIFIGSRNDLKYDRFYGGLIDEVMILNRALTASEIQEIYTGISGNQRCTPDSLSTTCGNSNCGTKTNNCGIIVSCGTCSGATPVCSSGTCIANQTTCTPNSLSIMCGNSNCGTKTNNCGTIVSCGTCSGATPVCASGTCIANQTQSLIICKNNLDCGTETIKLFCSGKSACTNTTTYTCNNAGKTTSYCSEKSSVKCSNCPDTCDGGFCVITPPSIFNTTNQKDMSKYSNKEVFLISDKDWKEVLPLVPLTTWTGSETNCVRGAGTPNDVCVYPTLIYHEEDSGFDADSIIHFMQQYGANKVTIIGNTPQELDNLLITQPEFGPGIAVSQIQRIPANDYLSYWKSFKDVVYVENDYELALMASTYASLLNAPLVIQGTALDSNLVFSNANVICVGNVAKTCNEQYTLEQLQQRYFDITKTKKFILVNPDDWTIKVKSRVYPDKSSGNVSEIATKVSLASPLLASAKHELILSINRKSPNVGLKYDEVDNFLESKMISYLPYLKETPDYDTYLTIMAATNAIPNKNPTYPTYLPSNYSANSSMCYNPIYGDYFCHGLWMYSSMDQALYADFLKTIDNYPVSLTTIPSSRTYNNVTYYYNLSIYSTNIFNYSIISINNSMRDFKPDISSGRIMSVTSTDIFGYVARDLFYNHIPKTNNMVFTAKSFNYMVNDASYWVDIFKNANYNSQCIINIGGDVLGAPSNCDKGFSGSDWLNQDLISYADHGTATTAGIASAQIPFLDSSLVFVNACKTCFNYEAATVCTRAIRRGALAYFGTIATDGTHNSDYMYTMNGIYYVNFSLGKSFAYAHRYFDTPVGRPSTLIGDPTLEVNPPYLLNKQLSGY